MYCGEKGLCFAHVVTYLVQTWSPELNVASTNRGSTEESENVLYTKTTGNYHVLA